MIVFSATITLTGTITFLGNAVNKGTINGNAVFKDSSQNGSGDETEADEDDPPDGIINGNATFFDSALNMNRGDITGTGTFNDCADNGGTVENEINNRKTSCPPSPFRGPYQDYNPPLIANWTFRGSGSRRLVAAGSLNAPTILSTVYGRWQKCPETGSCREQPETYRAGNYAGFHYVLNPRVTRDFQDNITGVINIHDGYCPAENYAKPLNRTDFFDCNGCIVEANGNVLADPNNPNQECSGSYAPDQIQNLVALWEPEFRLVTGDTEGTVVLSWTPLADLNNVDEYVVERRNSSSNTDWTTIGTWTADQVHNSAMYSNGVPASLDGVATFQYRVTAVNQGISGEPSEPAEFNNGVVTISNVGGAVSQTDPAAVDLSWSTPESVFSVITGYQIYRSKDGAFPEFFVEKSVAEAHATSPPSVTITDANNLGPGAYTFRVKWILNNTPSVSSPPSNEIIFS
jgi:hypothetical protein